MVAYCLRSFKAVFIPTPDTPGMLSEESPCKPFMSGTISGVSPSYLLETSSMSYIFLLKAVEIYTLVLSDTNCRVSVSTVTINESIPELSH